MRGVSLTPDDPQIKPLMGEEKQQKLAELREKIAAKCSVKAQQEAIEARANQAIRFKSGKDINKLRDELKAEEIVKEGEQKCRGGCHRSLRMPEPRLR